MNFDFDLWFFFFLGVMEKWADPIHSVAEQAGEDPFSQILRSSRGFREAQGRIRGSFVFQP